VNKTPEHLGRTAVDHAAGGELIAGAGIRTRAGGAFGGTRTTHEPGMRAGEFFDQP
jgi:hypothetical protein